MTAATGVREAPTNVGADVGAARRGASVEDARGGHAARYVWAVLRLLMGWTFFWAFIDKLFGLGFATAAESSWLNGGSPTAGFLKFATHGPFAEFYQAGADVLGCEHAPRKQPVRARPPDLRRRHGRAAVVGLGTNLRFGPPVGSDAPRPPVPDPPIDRLSGRQPG